MGDVETCVYCEKPIYHVHGVPHCPAHGELYDPKPTIV